MVWSAGLAPIKFVEGSSLEKGRGGRIVVDEYLRAADRVFALGDCAASREDPLPPTANAAEQQGAYLAKCFNETYYKSGADGAMPAKPDPVRPSAMPFAWLEILDNLWAARSEFRYVERGKMASMGMWGGVADLTKSEITPVGGTLTGVTAFASWRGAYLSKQVSVQNMILIPMCAPSVPDARGDGVQCTASPRALFGSRARLFGRVCHKQTLLRGFDSVQDCIVTSIRQRRLAVLGRAQEVPQSPSTGTCPSSPCRPAAIAWAAPRARRP